MIPAQSTKTTPQLTTTTPTNHPHIPSKIIHGLTKIQKTPNLKNMIIMTMIILQKKIPKIPIHLAQSTTQKSPKGPNSLLHITTIMRIPLTRKRKRVSKKLTDKINSKSKNTILLSLRSVEWDAAECLTLKVSLSMKKTVRKFFKKRENSSIHSSIESLQTNKNN